MSRLTFTWLQLIQSSSRPVWNISTVDAVTASRPCLALSACDLKLGFSTEAAGGGASHRQDGDGREVAGKPNKHVVNLRQPRSKGVAARQHDLRRGAFAHKALSCIERMSVV